MPLLIFFCQHDRRGRFSGDPPHLANGLRDRDRSSRSWQRTFVPRARCQRNHAHPTDRSRHRMHRIPQFLDDRCCVFAGSAATPAVIMARPPRKVFRKASFNARIFARLAFLSSFLYQSYALQPPSRYRRATWAPENATEGFPYSSAAAQPRQAPTSTRATAATGRTRRHGPRTSCAPREVTRRMPQ